MNEVTRRWFGWMAGKKQQDPSSASETCVWLVSGNISIVVKVKDRHFSFKPTTSPPNFHPYTLLVPNLSYNPY